MRIDCIETDNGVQLIIDQKKLNLEFPKEIWTSFPAEHKKLFVDNYAFLKTIHIPQFLDRHEKIEFSTLEPFFKNSIFHCMMSNIPFCADVDNISTTEKIRNFLNLEFRFAGASRPLPAYPEKMRDAAVISMSFGKDSLLTYALAKELGFDVTLAMSDDNDCVQEMIYKLAIAKKFSTEFNEKVWIIKNNTSLIHRYKYWNVPKTEWGFGHLLTEYCYNMIPFAHFSKANHIMIGNEKSCDDTYMNKEGYTSYPVYDQSSFWTLQLSKMTKSMTGNQLQVISLIEPLYELAIIKILHNRYPEIGKHQMSCFSDENEYGKQHHWCGHCSKCARIYIFLKANNILPERIGFKNDMLMDKHKHLYSIFGVEKKEGASVGYDASGCGRDEQLYAFYLACNNGTKGELIDLFKKTYFNEAKNRAAELHKTYYGIHESRTIPAEILVRLKKIFNEELD
ncbi:MAG: hypothetical protein KKF44_09045 [Nanoarchaeota archaeon]|nr:hypothetical protein [Nanoarchaeota archaeon]